MVLDRRTSSSAKRIIKICKISGESVIPCLPFRTISLAIRRENKTGLQLSPCLRPRLHMTASVRSPPTRTLALRTTNILLTAFSCVCVCVCV